MNSDNQDLGLRVRGLSHTYGKKSALDVIEFAVEKGKFCALLGPNGAGKSTLFSLLTRMFVPKQGTIEIAGIDLSQCPRKALAKLGIVFQQPTLDLDLSVRQNLDYFASLHGLSGKSARMRMDAALDRLDMRARQREKVRALNGGHRRRMEIARALIHQPEVLLLDEPTVGLDAASRKAITGHVHDLASQDGLTVLWATHLVDEVDPDDRLIILHQGTIRADGIAEEICGDQNLSDTFSAMTTSATDKTFRPEGA